MRSYQFRHARPPIKGDDLFGNQVMMPADLERLHKYMLEIEGADAVSDEMRAVIKDEGPELVHKLPPAKPQR